MANSSSNLSGKIQTVLGVLDPEKLGVTLSHEHLSLDSSALAWPWKEEKFASQVHTPVNLENLWWIQHNPYSNCANLRLFESEDAVLEEIKFFKSNGGCSIVENTVIGIRRNIKFYKQVAMETGVNIVSGTGFYVESSRPNTVSFTCEKMAEMMKSDILDGADGTDIKCGVIGEIGCSWPLRGSERRALQAAAHTSTETGCPIIIHPGRYHEAPTEIIRVIQEAGGDVQKVVMSHLDRTFQKKDDLLEFAKLGCYCEYDLFGIEQSHYQLNAAVDMPSDAQRIQWVKALIDEGYEDKITIGHDIHTKHRLMRFGGHGYSHILINIVPRMQSRGINKKSIDKMLVDNPKKWLTFK
ncbi:hypothetical protein ScPMuIL_006675 [Solemya velum]